MLQKKTYRAVVRGLEHYRKQHEQDRKENPGAIPPSWGMPIRMMIENKIRENREIFSKQKVEETVDYLVKQGLLVPYAGCVTFPTKEKLPTEKEIKEKALKIASEIFNS